MGQEAAILIKGTPAHYYSTMSYTTIKHNVTLFKSETIFQLPSIVWSIHC